MADVLQVQKRESTGSSASRRLRRDGFIPMVLYGHGEANQHLAAPVKQVQSMLRHHSKTVKLEGDSTENALVSEIHFDPLGIDVLHLDLIRVNLKEKVEVTVSVDFRGEAAGVAEGGLLLETQREVDIRCSAGSIPDEVHADVSGLNIGDNLTADQLTLPSGVELVTPGEAVLCHVGHADEGEEDEVEPATGAEPEVIAKGGEKPEED